MKLGTSVIVDGQAVVILFACSQTIHIRHGSAHGHCWTHLRKMIFGKHERQWIWLQHTNHNDDQRAHAWNRRNGIRFICCVSAHSGACAIFINPQRPDDRPATLIFSFCLPDGHQKGGTYHKNHWFKFASKTDCFVKLTEIVQSWRKQYSAILLVYTTTIETLLLLLFRSEATMVYTLSGPIVYTLFPSFPKDMVYTIAFLALWPWGRAHRLREEGWHGGGAHTFLPG